MSRTSSSKPSSDDVTCPSFWPSVSTISCLLRAWHRWSKGTRYARVFPAPVSAATTQAVVDSSVRTGNASAWSDAGCSKPAAVRASTIGAATPRESHVAVVERKVGGGEEGEGDGDGDGVVESGFGLVAYRRVRRGEGEREGEGIITCSGRGRRSVEGRRERRWAKEQDGLDMREVGICVAGAQ